MAVWRLPPRGACASCAAGACCAAGMAAWRLPPGSFAARQRGLRPRRRLPGGLAPLARPARVAPLASPPG
eukprot:7867835-Heterocapsa_arctica.AAC.1